jgi:hypothetical protein
MARINPIRLPHASCEVLVEGVFALNRRSQVKVIERNGGRQ